MPSTIPTALICAASPLIVHYFEAILQDEFEVIYSKKASEACEKLRIIDVHLIVLEEKTEKSDAIVQIKKVREISTAPLLVITGSLKNSYCRQLLTAGATELIRYPLEKIEIKKQIARARKAIRMQTKLFGLRSAITTVGEGNKNQAVHFHKNVASLSTIEIPLLPSESIGAIVLEVDEYGEKQENWSTIDKLIPKNCEAIIPISPGKRALLFKNCAREQLLNLADSFRKHVLVVGVGFAPKSGKKSAREQIAKVIAEAKENCK